MKQRIICQTNTDNKCLSSSFCNQFGCSRYEALIKSFSESPIGQAFVGKDGSFLLSNKAYANILGYELSEMEGLAYQDVTHEHDIKTDEDQAIAVSKGEINSYDMEKRYIKKDGSVIWVHLYVSGVFDENDQFLYYVVYGIDIDNLKRQESLAQFASNAGEVGIWTWNMITDELNWNAEMYKIFGIDEGEPVHYSTWANSLHPEDRERAENELEASSKKGHKFESYFRIIVNDKVKYIRAKAEKFGTSPNYLFIGSNVDITDFKEMRDEIDKNHEELEYFTYSVSHDLKSPLVTLSGFSSIISDEVNETSIDWELVKDSSNEIQKATQQLASTIDSILHLSRVGRIYIEESIVDTEEMVNEVISLNSIKIKESNVKINNKNNINIFVQREIFTSIVQNMIVNSIEHSSVEGQVLNINIDFQETEDGFLLSFSDDGKGMSQEQLENLFSYENRQYAKGFGMMIIKKGIDFHGGKMDITSEENKGTSYIVRFNTHGQ